MPLPTRQKYFLGALTVLACVTVASGIWEFAVAHAIHELVLGVLMLLLVASAWFVWPRASG